MANAIRIMAITMIMINVVLLDADFVERVAAGTDWVEDLSAGFLSRDFAPSLPPSPLPFLLALAPVPSLVTP